MLYSTSFVFLCLLCRTGDRNKEIYLYLSSGDIAIEGSVWDHVLLFAVDEDPYRLVDRAVVRAAQLSGEAKALVHKSIPRSLDCFGWCSWDAFYSAVSALGIMQAVLSLQSGGTPPTFVIVDDGWQQTDLDAVDSHINVDVLGPCPVPAKKKTKHHDEAYIEAESKLIAAVLDGMSAGSSAGTVLQELKAAESETDPFISYRALAHEHEKRQDQDGGKKKKHSLLRLMSGFLESLLAVLTGFLQALIVFVYETVIDPANHNSIPVRVFSFLVSGPLRLQMLDFMADQTNFTRRLTHVSANEKFKADFNSKKRNGKHSPLNYAEDFKSVVEMLKDNLGVEYIFCWHGISAYWSGISVEAHAMQKYDPHVVYATPQSPLLDIEPSMNWNPAVLAGMGAIYDPINLYNEMHKYLESCGVDGVKVDCQAGVGLLGTVAGGAAATAARYHAALEQSVEKFFQSNTINCMCHSTENIYFWRNTAVARASDDFYPNDTASHCPHIVACAYNGLFLSPLVIPDYDMFHSNHRAARAHAIARAVSGGPVYVSDAPGKHDFSILRKLVLPDGSILRALTPSKPTLDCLFKDVSKDGRTPLKLWSMNGVTGVLGVFNVQGSSWDRSRRKFYIHDKNPPKLHASFGPLDIPVFSKKKSLQRDYVVYYEHEGTAYMSCVSHSKRLSVELEHCDAISIVISPLYHFPDFDFAPLGKLDMFNAGGAVVSMTSHENEEDVIITLQVKGEGIVSAYCTKRPTSCTSNASPAPFSWSQDTCRLDITVLRPDESANKVNDMKISYKL